MTRRTELRARKAAFAFSPRHAIQSPEAGAICNVLPKYGGLYVYSCGFGIPWYHSRYRTAVLQEFRRFHACVRVREKVRQGYVDMKVQPVLQFLRYYLENASMSP